MERRWENVANELQPHQSAVFACCMNQRLLCVQLLLRRFSHVECCQSLESANALSDDGCGMHVIAQY